MLSLFQFALEILHLLDKCYIFGLGDNKSFPTPLI